jgi:pSer/pThr/pTyr-binding forkhead associated (FHA) protein
VAAQLIIYSSPENFSLTLNSAVSLTIGRARDNNIVLSDRAISRHHAVLQSSDGVEFFLIDANSRNGLFVNGQRITIPKLLQHSDRIIIGKTLLEFKQPTVEPKPPVEPKVASGSAIAVRRQVATKVQGYTQSQYRTVLLVYHAPLQGAIWQEVLSAQGVAVIWETADVDLTETIESLASLEEAFPDLLLLEIETQKANPHSICYWCRQHYPQLKIIFTSSIRSSITPAEQEWAVRQGAENFLPSFPQSGTAVDSDKAIQTINQVLKILNVPDVNADDLSSSPLIAQSFMPDHIPLQTLDTSDRASLDDL